MPHTALRRTSGVALTAALVAATPAANMPRASAADTPSLRVLTYNGVWWSGFACAVRCAPHLTAVTPSASKYPGGSSVTSVALPA